MVFVTHYDTEIASLSMLSNECLNLRYPWTGGVDTAGMTVHNSVVDPWRGASMGNGSMRPVSRPVFNGAGAVVGWETGTEWTNSVTGQVHGETQTATSNGFGGLHTQYTSKSAGRRNSPPSRFARPR